MQLEGTIINGVIVLDGNAALPEGTRVRVELSPKLPPDHPHAPYDRETELALLRESYEDVLADRGGVEARKFLKEMAIRRNMPLAPGE